MDISFEYYKIFYYVAKYENITKAAMVLKSSQPNVTRIIHILEDQLDCRLFLREPRGLKLTEEGKRLYAHVAIACQHLLDAEAELCRDKNVCSGTIELGVTETALHLFLLQNLHDFQTGYPEIKIRIQNNTTPEILKSLQNGRLDLAVVTTPFELHDALACEDLLTFREVPAGGPDYAALSDRPMTLKEFRLHSIIGLGLSLIHIYTAVYFCHTRGRVAGPGHIGYTLGHHRTQAVQIYKFFIFHTGSKGPGSCHDGIFKRCV